MPGGCWPEEMFSGPGVSMRDVSTANGHPAWPAHTLNRRRFGSDISRAQRAAYADADPLESGLLSRLLAWRQLNPDS
jgi:hypothetical protein